MKFTPLLNLKLPDPTEYVLVEDINENMEKIDEEIAKISDPETGVEAKLTTHLAETSGKHIHSSGSNANGNWIKFDDGTLICRVYKPALILTNPIPANSDAANAISFPAEFIGSDVSSSFEGFVTDGAGMTINTTLRKTHTGNGFWAFRIANPTSSPITRILDFMAIAIGRWKA